MARRRARVVAFVSMRDTLREMVGEAETARIVADIRRKLDEQFRDCVARCTAETKNQ